VVGEGVSVGLPVALLADLLLADLNDPTGADEAGPAAEPDSDAAAGDEAQVTTGRSLARFVDAFGPTLMAWVIRGGDADGSCGGVEEMVSHLQGFLDEEVEALHRQLDLVSGQPGRPACTVLGTALVEGQGVLCARSDGAILLALFDGSPGLSLLNAWEAART
jgi:hypothetical protein